MATVQSVDTKRLNSARRASENWSVGGRLLSVEVQLERAARERSRMKEQEQIIMAYRADGSRSTTSSETDASSRAPVSVRRSTSRTQDIDRHVGARIRERRIMLGLTQQQLADLIGVTYQQAHKYERGINRVSAGR